MLNKINKTIYVKYWNILTNNSRGESAKMIQANVIYIHITELDIITYAYLHMQRLCTRMTKLNISFRRCWFCYLDFVWLPNDG